MKKIILVIPLVILILITIFFSNSFKTKEVITISDSGEINVYFCPQDNCEKIFLDALSSAKKSLHCALFDIGLNSVQKKLLEKEIEVRIITDNDYLYKFNHSFVRTDKWGLMHNKFCIIDGKKVITGSMNPTENGAHKNNNNLIIIESTILARNYQDEFEEMWRGTFKDGERVKKPVIQLNNITIKNYFCPEDHCAYRVKEELKKANKSIHFMTFSFTHEGIANILLLKHLDGIEIKGVMEARQVSKYSQFNRLAYNRIKVIKDANKNNMHHKVFIIDEETVITGSFNPTNNGNKGNDENLLIIKDKEIAKKFVEEFDKVYAKAKSVE